MSSRDEAGGSRASTQQPMEGPREGRGGLRKEEEERAYAVYARYVEKCARGWIAPSTKERCAEERERVCDGRCHGAGKEAGGQV